MNLVKGEKIKKRKEGRRNLKTREENSLKKIQRE